MNLRHLRYFAALAREAHHGRAAAACHVTQPTLSEAIRQLEAELGVPLIERRGQRYRGLTAEGARVLLWAQRLLADEAALEQELALMRQGLSGTLLLGVIPAAMPVVPLLLAPFARRHPLVTVRLLSRSSIEIERGLDELVLAIGMTYLDNEPLQHVRSLPLYRERYLLLTPAGGAFAGRATVGWREAATLGLCLLTPEMQNRRIIDRLFREAGAAPPQPTLETDSALALIAHVQLGGWSSVVPHSFLALFRGDALAGLQAIPLVEPATAPLVGLVASDREPLPPLAGALLAVARGIDIAAALAQVLPSAIRISSENPI